MVGVVGPEKAAEEAVPSGDRNRGGVRGVSYIQGNRALVADQIRVIDVNREAGPDQIVSPGQNLVAVTQILHPGEEADGGWLLAVD
jgi:hypothetical protein